MGTQFVPLTLPQIVSLALSDMYNFNVVYQECLYVTVNIFSYLDADYSY